MKELNNIVFRFLWNSDVDKVKKNIVTQKCSHGGLKMLDLKNYIKGLKSTWIRRILFNNNSKWKTLLQNIVDIELLLSTGTGYLVCLKENIENDFWKDVFIAFKEIQDKNQISNWKEYISQSLWHNKRFKIGKETFFFTDLGIKIISYMSMTY